MKIDPTELIKQLESHIQFYRDEHEAYLSMAEDAQEMAERFEKVLEVVKRGPPRTATPEPEAVGKGVPLRPELRPKTARRGGPTEVILERVEAYPGLKKPDLLDRLEGFKVNAKNPRKLFSTRVGQLLDPGDGRLVLDQNGGIVLGERGRAALAATREKAPGTMTQPDLALGGAGPG